MSIVSYSEPATTNLIYHSSSSSFLLFIALVKLHKKNQKILEIHQYSLSISFSFHFNFPILSWLQSSIYSSSQTLNNKKNQNASSIPIRRHSQNLPIYQTRPKLPPTRSVGLEIPTEMDLPAVQSTNHHRRIYVLYGGVTWTGWRSLKKERLQILMKGVRL